MKIAKLMMLTAALASLPMVTAGCASDPASDVGDEDIDSLDDGKYEAWNTANNPAYVDSTFSYSLLDLPVKGQTKQAPWSGDYWATARDSINVKWDGATSDSPAQKVAKAFNLPNFPKEITDTVGIYGHFRKECKETSECADLKDGSSCVTPAGATGAKPGRCIPGWWGICHGWAPAALAESAPVRPVTKNGVTFYPGDLEGLASYVYSENLPTKFLSERCGKDENDLGVDNNGRIRDGLCRDMNPGTLFVLASNMIGLRGVGFVEDRTGSSEVWNQPVRGFEVTNAAGGKLKEITKAEAIGLLGADMTFSNIFADATLKKGDKKTGFYTATAAGSFTVKTSGTGDADLYVKKGAEATASANDCSSTGSTATEECKVTLAVGDKLYYLVLGYSDESKATLAVGTVGAGGSYTYNTSAKRFFHVMMDVQYITESPPARESHITQIDNFTRTDSYEFILEADAAGKALGGEWLGESRTKHPDFAWWPSGKPSGDLNGLTYTMVKSLLDQAKAEPTMPGTGETTVLMSDVAFTAASASKYATIGVPAGAKLEVTMTGTGNADLFVGIGRRPTVTVFVAKSVGPTSNETVTITAPAGGGTYYVRARPPTTGRATVTVTAKIIR